MLVSVVPVGNSRGVSFPALVFDTFAVKDKMNLEVTDEGILLTPVPSAPRLGWTDAFRVMHANGDDALEAMPEVRLHGSLKRRTSR